MYKQSPSRNHRSKGFKAKHIVQICLLLAVCFWLIYQVKHSHDKKEEFVTEDEKVVGKVESDAEILRLGRKDLPRIMEIAIDEHSFDEEEQEAEEEETKHEDDERDIEDNISDDREDEIDKNDLEKAEAETEHEDEINKSEKEVEKAEPAHEKEHVDEDNEKDDNEEIDDVEDENRSETEEHEEAKDDEGDVKLEEQVRDEAREEQYKADDASSEVGHDNQTIMPEAGKVSIEHTNEIWSKIGQENETGTSNMEDVGLQLRQDEVNINGTSSNGTIEGGSGNENLTVVENISERINKSEAMDDENRLEPVAGSNNTENVNTNVVESSLSDTNTMSAEGGESIDNGTVDSDEGVNVIPHDLIDASSDSTLTQDEKDSRMDLDTLPEITTEVQNTDETMAE